MERATATETGPYRTGTYSRRTDMGLAVIGRDDWRRTSRPLSLDNVELLLAGAVRRADDIAERVRGTADRRTGDRTTAGRTTTDNRTTTDDRTTARR